MVPASVRRSSGRWGSARSVTIVPETRRDSVGSDRTPLSRSNVRRSGEDVSGSVNRERGGVYTVFTARPNV